MPSEDQRERLRAWLDLALKKPGKTVTGLAARLGITPPRVTEMRKGRRGIKAEELPLIASYLGEQPPGGSGSGHEGVKAPGGPGARIGLRLLKVVGVAEAGAFRQQDMLAQVADAFIEVPPSEAYPDATHYALLVRGDSMDKRGILDGDHVSVVDYAETGAPLRNGTIVHVQRSRDGGYLEWTLKEVHAFHDRFELRPRSSNTAHHPFVIPRLAEAEPNGEEIRILGVVVSLHRSLGF